MSLFPGGTNCKMPQRLNTCPPTPDTPFFFLMFTSFHLCPYFLCYQNCGKRERVANFHHYTGFNPLHIPILDCQSCYDKDTPLLWIFTHFPHCLLSKKAWHTHKARQRQGDWHGTRWKDQSDLFLSSVRFTVGSLALLWLPFALRSEREQRRCRKFHSWLEQRSPRADANVYNYNSSYPPCFLVRMCL